MYAADFSQDGDVLGATSGCTAFGRVIKNLNLDRYPWALLWMEKTTRAQAFAKVTAGKVKKWWGDQGIPHFAEPIQMQFWERMGELWQGVRKQWVGQQVRLAIRDEIPKSTKILIDRIQRAEGSFIQIDASLQDQIMNELNVYENLSIYERKRIARHVVRDILALDTKQKDIWESFQKGADLGDYMPVHEESAIAASDAFNREQAVVERDQFTTIPDFVSSQVQFNFPFGTVAEKNES